MPPCETTHRPASCPDLGAAREEDTIPFDRSYDALIIGAGFYGTEIALELRRCGLPRVLLVDRERAIMRRASYANQARVHNGYHYPRALATAERSRANFEAFVAEYADAVVADMTSLYAIAAGSRVSPTQFEAFCRMIGAPCHPAPRHYATLFDPALIEQTFLTRELVFDAARIAARLERALADAEVTVLLNTEARILAAAAGGVAVQAGNQRIHARHVVNATYADIEFAGVALASPVRKELAEMLLLAPPPELHGIGITVMDGPFFSALPFPAAGLHSLSHVRYTPHAANETPLPETLAPQRSNRDAMLRDSMRYLPCLARARVIGSMFEMKATLMRNEHDDGRPVMIERAAALPNVLSVLGAKIDNIYEVRSYLRTQDWGAA